MLKKLASKLLVLTFLAGGLGFILTVPNTSASAAKRCCQSDAECTLGKVCRKCKCVIEPIIDT